MNLDLSWDALTIRLIATGLIEVRNIAEQGRSLSYPYPAPLQLGWDRLVVRCLERNIEPPVGIDELFAWCENYAMSQWPLDLPDSIWADDTLIDGPFLTELCDELACDNPDVEAELTQNTIMGDALIHCRSHQAQDAYTAFRQLLIEHPVLTDTELRRHRVSPPLVTLDKYLGLAYVDAPISHIVDGRYVCCPSCGCLLQRAGGALICEHDRCRAQGQPTPKRSFSATEDGVKYLKRGLRRFVTLPGLAELHLATELRKLGLDVELWPGIDAYDLRVCFPNGDAWAIDVKDQKSPERLAAGVQSFPSEPNWTRAFIVFPDARRHQRSDYRRAFENRSALLKHEKEIKAAFIRDLLRQARAQLRKVG